MILIQYYGLLRQVVKVRQEKIVASDIHDVIRTIKRKYGHEAASKAKRSIIMVNGKNAALLNGYRTSLKSGDRVQILPVMAGG